MAFLTRRQAQLDSDISETEGAASSDGQLDAIIGGAAAGSVVLILIAIFIGYWLVKRRARRQSALSYIVINDAESRPPLEAPRRARRRSLVLSLGDIPYHSSSPTSEKPLPPLPAAGTLLSSDAFTVTPMAAAFSPSVAVGKTWPYSEKSSGSFESALSMVPSPPPPTRTKLRLARMITVKRPPPIDIERAQAATVEQAVDSGLRLADSAIVPPPYTPT
ncbi:hypothetical protein L226DRAFT_614333 [Lentinus tigrinus ALCF2SS1-7]|uniref:Uncharacterized protein n=1 Tax=Lentinus tigrinus ALCF2SS1-6 TaxID=1328759 RepID=A0A5C2S1M5_9APHY|nr:hypothetical protein L227DRAFT_655674 [Lentinus tigrinus ALCF2SS1-6]RPD73074.1 hypothetical protein L226DRAFT_614333 [Lentinus tigrinus ALCF2SS1-7]